MMKPMRLKLILTAAAAGAIAVSCSNPHKVKDVDNEITGKGQVADSTVGLDKNDQMILQNEKGADQELRAQKWKNAELEQKVVSTYELLNRCRNDLADPRLGGTGSVTEIPEIENLEAKVKSEEQFGLNKEGKLVVVKREMFLDRLQGERERATSLAALQKVVNRHKDECLRQMSVARVKAGLPSQWITAKGHYTQDGKWVMTSPAEHTLDDAFRLRAEQGADARVPANH